MFSVSLAFADSIIGFLLLATVTPNMVFMTSVTEKEAVRYVINDINSAKAITVGSVLTVTMQVRNFCVRATCMCYVVHG